MKKFASVSIKKMLKCNERLFFCLSLLIENECLFEIYLQSLTTFVHLMETFDFKGGRDALIKSVFLFSHF